MNDNGEDREEEEGEEEGGRRRREGGGGCGDSAYGFDLFQPIFGSILDLIPRFCIHHKLEDHVNLRR